MRLMDMNTETITQAGVYTNNMLIGFCRLIEAC